MKTTLAALAAAIVTTGIGLFWFGAYDIAATEQHLAPTYWLMDTAMRRSVIQRAKRIEAPPLGDNAKIEQGVALFRRHCVQCHGGPGVAPEGFALGLTPSAANLVHTAREWQSAELFWTIKYGIKMTGMPAWAFRLSDDEIWAIVALLRMLPRLSPADYAALSARVPDPPAVAPAPMRTGVAPDPQRGKIAIQQYACVTCHKTPGIVGSSAPVGPPLEGIGSRAFIAGVIPNSPENLLRWLRTPQEVSPHSAMPNLGVSERDALDIAAYLYTLR